MTGVGRSARVQRLPRVPIQQKPVLMSVLFPPDVPSFTGADCAEAVSLGKICGETGVGVGAGVLEPPPPHPTAPISTIKPNKNPDFFAIAISPLIGNCRSEKPSVFLNFTPRSGRLTRVSARP